YYKRLSCFDVNVKQIKKSKYISIFIYTLQLATPGRGGLQQTLAILPLFGFRRVPATLKSLPPLSISTIYIIIYNFHSQIVLEFRHAIWHTR
ncbi:MAG: hypothetical protein ABJD74_10445, partial [Roseibium sp.]|uniref:hypothetical protein n=1 Tax=Roseibium sp. TaxID=1936156 RepID=UPI003263F135